MRFENLKNSDLQERLKGAQSPEDVLALVRESECELTDSELESISGGGWDGEATKCPRCGSENADVVIDGYTRASKWHCYSCGHEWG